MVSVKNGQEGGLGPTTNMYKSQESLPPTKSKHKPPHMMMTCSVESRAVGQNCMTNAQGVSEAQNSNGTINADIDLRLQMSLKSSGDDGKVVGVEARCSTVGAQKQPPNLPFENQNIRHDSNSISTSTTSTAQQYHVFLNEIVKMRRDDPANSKSPYFREMIEDSNRNLESTVEEKMGEKFRLLPCSQDEDSNKVSGFSNNTIDLTAEDHLPTSNQHETLSPIALTPKNDQTKLSNLKERAGKTLTSPPHLFKEYQEHDVLLGSRTFASHKGNRILKYLLQKNVSFYINGTKEQKELLPSLVYKEITETLKPGGRFLRCYSGASSVEKMWYCISEKEASLFISRTFLRATSSLNSNQTNTTPQKESHESVQNDKPDKAIDKMKATETPGKELKKKDENNTTRAIPCENSITDRSITIRRTDLELPTMGCENTVSKKRKLSCTTTTTNDNNNNDNNNNNCTTTTTNDNNNNDNNNNNNTREVTLHRDATANVNTDNSSSRDEKISNETLSVHKNDRDVFGNISTSSDISVSPGADVQKIQTAERLWEIVPDDNLTYPQRVENIKLKASHYGQILHDTLKFSSCPSNGETTPRSNLLEKLRDAEKMWGIEESEGLSIIERMQKIQSTSKKLMEKLQLYA